MIKWHHKDAHNRMYLNLTDGKKIGMPRYYKEKIYSDEKRKAIGYFARQKVLKEKAKQMAKNPNYYRDKFESDKASFRTMDKNSNKIENNKI